MSVGPEPDGATPLADEERVGLIADWVATREDLNVVEQANVARGLTGVLRGRPPSLERALDDVFLRGLHRRLFGAVWSWAGTYRTTERNIGLDPWQVPVAVRSLLDDARYWLAPGVEWITVDQALCQVHHRVVAIHPFPNGNGRTARAYTDALARAAGRPVFTWGGGGDLQRATPDRGAYLRALRALDRGPEDSQALDALVAFARS
ncbi:cell filamentation protein [Luteimicrobium album]|uniref:Cell filamentation protein n=1 Tax=Luteimicrobium album TaxID=1054550 RepID=A0ABQ6I0Z4_9MICO|nr:mobile mystery protein B [Luteimicrobium album]GMA23624.1 cell filamentation protein [Luteimicrobium album]